MADESPQDPLLSSEMLMYAEAALNDAIGFIVAGDDPFIPFVMSWDMNGKRKIHACMSDDYNEAIKLGWRIIENDKESTVGYALAWSGYYGKGEERRDAIYMETTHVDHPKTVTLAATYQIHDGEYEAIDTVVRWVQDNVLKNGRKDT